MLDIQYIRNHAEAVQENCKQRGVALSIAELLALDDTRRSRIAALDELRSRRNRGSKNKPTPEEISEMRALGETIRAQERELDDIQQAYEAELSRLPNLTHPEAPVGKDESGNRVLRAVGSLPVFSFAPKEHHELGELLDVIDIERAAKVTGSRFGYLKGDVALLEFALLQHAFSIVTSEVTLAAIAKKNNLAVSPKPFIPVVPPVMIRPDVMQKMGRLEPKEERYHIPSDDVYLVGSAEHTLGPLHMDEVLAADTLPIRYIGFSTAFRREAGSYGKDTKGILRVHQFDKLEMESFTLPEDGEKEQDFIIAIQEYLMQSLGIPYRIVFKCTGDMGAPDYREFDVESWLPGQQCYRETHTSDYMTDYQSRRLNIRVKRENGDPQFVHMNDATAFAIGRTIIAIMENYQQADGSVVVPDVLQKYLGKSVIVKRGAASAA